MKLDLEPSIPPWFDLQVLNYCERHECRRGVYEDIVDSTDFWRNIGLGQDAKGGELLVIEPVLPVEEVEQFARQAAERLNLQWRVRLETWCGKPGAVRVEFWQVRI